MQHSNKFDINEYGMSHSDVVELKAIQRRNQYKIISPQKEGNGDDLDLECQLCLMEFKQSETLQHYKDCQEIDGIACDAKPYCKVVGTRGYIT